MSTDASLASNKLSAVSVATDQGPMEDEGEKKTKLTHLAPKSDDVDNAKQKFERPELTQEEKAAILAKITYYFQGRLAPAFLSVSTILHGIN